MSNKKKIYTIHEVKVVLTEVHEILGRVNCHAIDSSLDGFDYNDMRKAYQMLQDVTFSRWTNQIL